VAVQSQQWLRCPGMESSFLPAPPLTAGGNEGGREMLLFCTPRPASWSVKVTSTPHIAISMFLRVIKILNLLNFLLVFSVAKILNMLNFLLVFSVAILGHRLSYDEIGILRGTWTCG